jgi:hypothetical protein
VSEPPTADPPLGSLAPLAATLRAEGGLLADALVADDGIDELAARAGSGHRAAAAPQEYALVLAAVREGYLLHYGRGRLVSAADADLALLAGDRLYALGLARLADLGDLDAVAELADLISLCAQAHADDDRDLAAAAWEAAACAIGEGSSPAHARAKQRARAGEPGAALALRATASAPGS